MPRVVVRTRSDERARADSALCADSASDDELEPPTIASLLDASSRAADSENADAANVSCTRFSPPNVPRATTCVPKRATKPIARRMSA